MLLPLLLGILLFAIGCGGGGSSMSGSPEPTPTPTSAVQIKIGDSSSERLLSVEFTASALHLIDAKGTSINILPSSRRLEFTHLAGTSQLIAALNMPQGTYNQAIFDGSDFHVTYLDYTGQPQEYTVSDAVQFTVALPSLVIGSLSTIVSVDFDLANSITVDPTNVNPPVVTPVLTFSTMPVRPTPTQQPEDGSLENVVGLVNSVAGSKFTMTPERDAFQLTFDTSSGTQFENVTLTTLPNTLVKVEGITLLDGSLEATKVSAWADKNGAEFEGVLTNYYNYITSEGIMVIAQDAVGSGFFSLEDTVGKTARAGTLGATYAVNSDGMDMTGITFTFDPHTANLNYGQRVRMMSTSGFIRGDPQLNEELTAQTVTLEKQALTGIVQNYQAGATAQYFDLMLDAGSYLTILNHASSMVVHVVQQPGTNLHGISSVQNGDNVRVRGLLFYDYQTGFHMVAQRIWK